VRTSPQKPTLLNYSTVSIEPSILMICHLLEIEQKWLVFRYNLYGIDQAVRTLAGD